MHRHTDRITALVLIAAVWAIEPATAQDPQPVLTELKQQLDTAENLRASLADAVSELRELRNATNPVIAAPNSHADPLAMQSDLIISDGPMPGLAASNIQSIESRIELIKKLVEQQKAKQSAGSSGPKPGAQAAEPHGEESEQKLLEPHLQVVPHGDIVGPTAIPLDSSETVHDSHPVTTQAFQVSGTPIVKTPVDSFALANSLFQIGNFQAALQNYKSAIASNNDSHDQAWLKFFSACCHRMLGDAGSAEALFREITNKNLANYPSEASIWWLSYLNTKTKLQREFAIIDAEITAIKSKTNDE